MKLGDAIRAAREAKGWNQAELGAALGVSGAAVGNWERGGAIAEDNFSALKDLLPLDLSEVPPGELDSLVGRPSRRAGAMGGPRPDPLGYYSRRREEIRSMQAPRISRAGVVRPGPDISFGEHARAMVFRRVDDVLRECLPEHLRSNVRGTASAGGYQYPLLYVSQKLIADLDVNAHTIQGMEFSPDSPLPPAPLIGSPNRTLRLAVIRQSMAETPNAALPFFALFTPFDDKAFMQPSNYPRRVFENKVLGIELMMFDSIKTLAAVIEAVESGQLFIEEHLDEDAI